MKLKGPRNRGSHPDGLPLARSGLYISCAYPPAPFVHSPSVSRRGSPRQTTGEKKRRAAEALMVAGLPDEAAPLTQAAAEAEAEARAIANPQPAPAASAPTP
jgi:hypothetical protein